MRRSATRPWKRPAAEDQLLRLRAGHDELLRRVGGGREEVPVGEADGADVVVHGDVGVAGAGVLPVAHGLRDAVVAGARARAALAERERVHLAGDGGGREEGRGGGGVGGEGAGDLLEAGVEAAVRRVAPAAADHLGRRRRAARRASTNAAASARRRRRAWLNNRH